ncbi:MAG TPA: phospholipase D-like domain-containing protein [Allosphingosinicella sp.]|nr:phospholipase D-like domain-containing protein [Allosphingosinicella sp.]
MAALDLRVYCGADSNFLAWWSPAKIDGCLGYGIKRRIDGGAPEPLTAYVGFGGAGPVQANADGQPSTKWPFQRFTWSDFEPHPGTVEYQVVAIVGTPAAPTEGSASDWVAPAPPEFGDIIPYFNFGTISSRWFSTMAAIYPAEFDTLRKKVSGAGSEQALADVLNLPQVKGAPAGSPTIGDKMGGTLRQRVHKLLADAKDDPATEIYAALFELAGDDLVEGLAALGARCHLLLANGTHKDNKDENAEAAAALQGKVDLKRRMLKPNGVFAHNKFVVVCQGGKPTWAWSGSTNWTPHGLCSQANNGIEIRDPDVAQAYFDAWHRLAAAGDATPPPQQPPAQEQYHFAKDGLTTSIFFSPHKMAKADGAKSPDLVYANALIRGAKQGILSLMLDPGWAGSMLQAIRETAGANQDLYVRGVVNSDPTVMAKKDPTAIGFLHGHEAVPSNYDIVLPAQQKQDGEPIDDYLGRLGIVVVHSKLIVIDPLGDRPVVMTGSHNMGVKAATQNDDNLVIIEGDRDLAVAYALNVMSVFNHFWWRHNMASPSKKAAAAASTAQAAGPATAAPAAGWTGLRTDDGWQDKFYDGGSEVSEARFWGVAP